MSFKLLHRDSPSDFWRELKPDPEGEAGAIERFEVARKGLWAGRRGGEYRLTHHDKPIAQCWKHSHDGKVAER